MEHCLLPGVEDPNHISFTFHLSQGCTASGESSLKKILINNQKQRISFKMKITELNGQPVYEADASLHPRMWTKVKNDSAEDVQGGVGNAMVYLKDVLNTEHPVSVRLPIKVDNAPDREKNTVPVKGFLTITFDRFQPYHKSMSVSSHFRAPTRFSILPQNLDSMIGIIRQHAVRCNMTYEGFPPTEPSTQGMRLPFWNIASGMISPGVAFVAPRPEASPESWWMNTMRVGLRRYRAELNEPVEESVKWFLSSQPSEKDIMNVISMAFAASTCNISAYLSDGCWVVKEVPEKHINRHQTRAQIAASVDHRKLRHHPSPKFDTQKYSAESINQRLALIGQEFALQPANVGAPFSNVDQIQQLQVVRMDTEDFSLGPLRVVGCEHCGSVAGCDCEDVTIETGMVAVEMCETTTFTDPLLLKCRDTLQHYSPSLNLVYVNGAQASDAYKAGMRKNGHGVLSLEAKDHLIDGLEQYNEARPVMEGMQRRTGSIPPEYKQNPVYWVETTGSAYPSPNQRHADRTIAAYLCMKFADEPNFAGIRWMMPQPEGDNRFYYSVSEKMPLEWTRSYAAVQHAVVTMHPDGKPTLGVKFPDYTSGKAKSGLVPIGSLTQDERDQFKALLAHSFPVCAYQPPLRPIGSGTRNHRLDSVIAKLKGMNRPDSTVENRILFSMFPRYDQINDKLIASIDKMIVSTPAIYSVRYEEENHSGDTRGAFAVHFYLDAVKVAQALQHHPPAK